MTWPCPAADSDGFITIGEPGTLIRVHVSSLSNGQSGSCSWSQDANGIHLIQSNQVPAQPSGAVAPAVPMSVVPAPYQVQSPYQSGNSGLVGALLLVVVGTALLATLSAGLAAVCAAVENHLRRRPVYHNPVADARTQMDRLSDDFLNAAARGFFGGDR